MSNLSSMDFATLYERLRLQGGEGLETMSWSCLDASWREFLLAHRPQLCRDEADFQPHLQLLQLAVAHGEDSPITGSAWEWLRVAGPSEPWLRELDLPARLVYPPTVLSGHDSWIFAVAFSPDGKFAATASKDGTARVWDAERGSCLHVLDHGDCEVTALVVDSSGSRLVTGGSDGELRLWSLDSGELLGAAQPCCGKVRSIKNVPDGVVSVGSEGIIVRWDTERDSTTYCHQAHRGPIVGLAVAAGRLLTAGLEELRLWETERAQLLLTLEGHERPHSLDLSRCGRRGVSCSREELKVWDLESGRLMWEAAGAPFGVDCAVFTPDGRSVVLGEREGMRVWEVESGELICQNEAFGWPVAITPDGRHALGGYGLDRILLCEVETGRKVAGLPGHRNWVLSMDISSDGLRAISGGMDSEARIWSLEHPGTSFHTDDLPLDCLMAADLARRWGVSAGLASLTIWDLEKRVAVHHLKGHSFAVEDAAFSPDGEIFVTVSPDHEPRVWDVVSGACRHVLEGHQAGCTSIAITPDGKTAVTSSRDTTLRVWNLTNGQPRHVLSGHREATFSVSLDADGRFLASSSLDGEIRLWSTKDWCCLHSLRSHTRATRVSLTPDGSKVLSTGGDGLRVWDTESGTMSASDESGISVSSPLLLTEDGQFALMAMADSSLGLWDVESARFWRCPGGHGQGLSSMAFLREPDLAVSVGIDRTLRAWDLRQGKCLAVCCGVGSVLVVDGTLVVRSRGGHLRRIELCQPGCRES